ncbi:MAG: ABC transporter substrate-binding protein [Litorilinea sp.]
MHPYHSLTRNIIRNRPRLILITLLMGLLVACAPVASPTAAPSAPSEATESTETAEAATTTPPTTDLQPVTLGVGFIPSVQFATLYVAIEKGFYADMGLDVSIDYGFENDYLLLTATDEIQFMVGSGDQVILGRAQDLPVRYVMNWYSEYPVVIFARADAGIATPADLAGTRIGIPGPFGASYVAFRAILEAGDLTENDVTLESIGFTQATAVQQDLVDAAVDYHVNGPIVLAAEGIDTVQIRMDDYLHMPSNGLVTNEVTIDKNPELVADMVQATLQGVAYTLANPDEAFQIALQYVPEAGGDNEAINRAIFDAVLASWQTQPDYVPGETKAADWQAATDFMARIGLIEQTPAVETLYTNAFLPTAPAGDE